MSAVLHKNLKTGNVDHNLSDQARPSNRVPQRSISLPAPKLDDISEASRKEVLTDAGKQISSSIGSRILVAMLEQSGLTMREVSRRSGFDVALLSNIAKGKRASGPELWTLVALADAMDFDLKVSFSKR